jgi:hypothetical protein
MRAVARPVGCDMPGHRSPSEPDLPRLAGSGPAEGLQDPVVACLFAVRADGAGVVVYRHGGVICTDPESRNAPGEAGGWWDL